MGCGEKQIDWSIFEQGWRDSSSSVGQLYTDWADPQDIGGRWPWTPQTTLNSRLQLTGILRFYWPRASLQPVLTTPGFYNIVKTVLFQTFQNFTRNLAAIQSHFQWAKTIISHPPPWLWLLLSGAVPAGSSIRIICAGRPRTRPIFEPCMLPMHWALISF